MKFRHASWITIAALMFWAAIDQFGRYVGRPGAPEIELCVDGKIAIATFAVAIAMAIGASLSKRKRNSLLFVIGLVLMVGPLWLSTRHVFVGGGYIDIEEVFFLDYSIDHGDPEVRCFVKKGSFIIAIDPDGHELGHFLLGIYPWNISDGVTVDSLNYGCPLK